MYRHVTRVHVLIQANARRAVDHSFASIRGCVCSVAFANQSSRHRRSPCVPTTIDWPGEDRAQALEYGMWTLTCHDPRADASNQHSTAAAIYCVHDPKHGASAMRAVVSFEMPGLTCTVRGCLRVSVCRERV